jgi:hypothetical protein
MDYYCDTKLYFMKYPHSLLHLFFIVFLFSFFSVRSQSCSNCSDYALSEKSSTYTVSTGQTLCIDSLSSFSGNIVMNGGTLCISGNFQPASLTFNSGSIINRGVSYLSSINLSSNRTFINKPGAILNVDGSLTISGGILTNLGVVNVSGNLQNNSGQITNSNIINCTAVTGNNTITNNGLLNTN